MVIGFFRLVEADVDELAVGVVVDTGVDGSGGVDAEDTRVDAVDTTVVAMDARVAVNMCGK